MGTIVCQACEQIIEYFDSEKSSVLYGVCQCCGNPKDEKPN